MSDRRLEDLFEIGLILSSLFVFGIFFLVIDFSSPESNVDVANNFVVGMISIIAPTSIFDVFVSVSVAVIGGITVGRENVAAGVVVTVFLYGIVSFAIGWFTAPV